MSLPCANCDGGVCDDCRDEVAERVGGDTGLSASEIENLRLRDELRIAKADKLRAEVAAAEAQRATAEMKAERDAALAQLALLSREALA